MRIKTIGATYLLVGVILAAFVAMLVAVVRTPSASAHIDQGAAAALLQPMVALVILTAVALLMAVVYRNLAIVRGAVSERYFQTFADKPAEWVERPIRTYMNLLELPVLFYVVSLFMLSTGKFDSVQVSLAWVFVMTRYVHAFIYIGFNYVPLRFAAFLTGVFTLAVMWTRFAEQNLN